MSDFNIAVIGAGYWGRKHVDELSRSKSARLVAVSDLLEANRRICSENFGVGRTVEDYREILEDGKVDAVSICTNNELHYQVAKEALLAGKHVLVEKPLTMDAATSSELVGLAKKKGRVLCVGHLFRFNNSVRKLRQMHQDGFFGRLFFIKVQWTNHNGPVAGRTVLADLGPHAFDIPHFICGMWPEKSSYFGSQFRRGELEETAFIESDYGNGMFLYSELSWLLPEKKREIFVVGERACARADVISQKVVAQEVMNDEANREGKLKGIFEVPVAQNNALSEELESFVSDCKAGNPSPINSGEIGLAAVQSLFSCRKA
ncbi:MAG: Gfo/Idh/MocA family oxidoreductase [Candidatus Micrarchaeia archaeon]